MDLGLRTTGRKIDQPASADWPTLVTRVVHDLARIGQTEIRLFQAGLEPVLSNAIDRSLASLATLLAFATSGLCLLTAIVLFLSRWLGWPGAFAVAGGISFAAGLVSLRMSKGGAVQSSDQAAIQSDHPSDAPLVSAPSKSM